MFAFFSGLSPKCSLAVRWCLALIAATAFSLLLPYAMGYCYGGHAVTEFWDWRNVILPVLAIVILSQHWISRWFLAIPALLCACAYLPAGILYGRPNILVAMALLQTNAAEAAEFLSNTPWRILLAAVGLLALGVLAIALCKRLRLHSDHVCYLIIAAALIVVQLVYGQQQPPENIRMVEFGKGLGQTFWSTAEELREERNAPPPDWKIQSVRPAYQNYVVVIGESRRRDYASVYGYPLQTTPFLDHANGVFLTNFVAPGGNTGISLPRLLSLNTPGTDEFSRANNLLTMARAAGFETWWLSNQGRGGAFDNPIAQIGVRAEHTVWLKGNYADPNIDDDDLLPKFKEALASAGDKPRLFVLHLMGAHPTFCVRLSGRTPAFDVGDESMSCYLTTYRMLDSLLERVVGELKQTAKGGWSVLYFADHGLTMSEKPGTQTGRELEHGYDHRQNYDVPLFVLSSDSKRHETNPALRSGYRMLEGMADWMGIKAENMPVTGLPAFWSRKNDEAVRVFGGKDYKSLGDDPAIVFEDKKDK